jgi:hypothetical protein
VAAATQLGVGLLAVAADGLFAGTAAATMFGEGTLGAAAAKTLQSGGNTIKAATAEALNAAGGVKLTRAEWSLVVRELKAAEGVAHDAHGIIRSTGDYLDSAGRLIGNLFDYVP